MQNKAKSFFRIKPLTKYDFRPYVEPGKRKWILETAIKTHPKLDCRGEGFCYLDLFLPLRRHGSVKPIQRRIRHDYRREKGQHRNLHPKQTLEPSNDPYEVQVGLRLSDGICSVTCSLLALRSDSEAYAPFQTLEGIHFPRARGKGLAGRLD